MAEPKDSNPPIENKEQKNVSNRKRKRIRKFKFIVIRKPIIELDKMNETPGKEIAEGMLPTDLNILFEAGKKDISKFFEEKSKRKKATLQLEKSLMEYEFLEEMEMIYLKRKLNRKIKKGVIAGKDDVIPFDEKNDDNGLRK